MPTKVERDRYRLHCEEPLLEGSLPPLTCAWQPLLRPSCLYYK